MTKGSPKEGVRAIPVPVVQPRGTWRHLIQTAALADPVDAAPHVTATIAVLDAALNGRWQSDLIERAFANQESRFLAAIDRGLRRSHGSLAPDVLDAARRVLRILSRPLANLFLIQHGGAPPPAESGDDVLGLGTGRSLGEALCELETADTTEGPRNARYRCPRCGSGAVEVREQKVMGRQLFEVSCAACGLGDSWYEGESSTWAIKR